MKKISINEQREIELNMLFYINEICNRENIVYSLCGGSLIGAIRHKGFIPWDDDVDIFLTRDNYNKLVSILKKEKKYKLYSPGETDGYLYGFSKLMDTATILIGEEEWKRGTPEIGVFIDIYPIDNIPDKAEERKKFHRTIQMMQWKANIANNKMYKYHPNWVKSVIKGFIYYPLHLYYRKNGDAYWMKKMEEFVQKNPYVSNNLMGSVYSRYGEKEVLPKKVYEQIIEVTFENQKVKILKEYDSFLHSVYGDYMKLPPREKQVLPHEYDAFWRE